MSLFDITLTNEIYAASKAPEVRNLWTLPFEDREAKASDLNDEGFVIDRQIDIWGWDPVKVMVSRAQLGYPWVPSAFQPNLENPLHLGSAPSTDFSKPWPKSIKVSVDAADYPPFSQPAPKPDVVKPVGVEIGNGLFAANITAVWQNGVWLFRDGDPYTQDGVKYVFKKVNTPFGPSVSWRLA